MAPRVTHPQDQRRTGRLQVQQTEARRRHHRTSTMIRYRRGPGHDWHTPRPLTLSALFPCSAIAYFPSVEVRLGWRLTSAVPGDPGFEVGVVRTPRMA